MARIKTIQLNPCQNAASAEPIKMPDKASGRVRNRAAFTQLFVVAIFDT
jgi:hypothetical protein